MTELEEMDLKAYFEVVGIPDDCETFDAWYNRRFDGPDEELEYKSTLALARAYIAGYVAGLAHYPGEPHAPAMLAALQEHVRENLNYGTPLPQAAALRSADEPEFPIYIGWDGQEHGEF